MSGTKTTPAIASNEFEFQWSREVLFLSDEQPNTYAELDDQAKLEVRTIADDFGSRRVMGFDIF